MRQITERTCEAFRNTRPIKISNSEVKIEPSGNAYYRLHWNLIALYSPRAKELTIRDCGRQTQTTKDRLNWILQEFGLWWIIQEHWTWYYANQDWRKRRNWQMFFNF